MKTRLSTMVGVAMAFVLATVCAAWAVSPEVPRFITYQGRLTTSGGAAVPDGNHTIAVRVWRDAISTNPLDLVWNSGAITVATVDGLFTVRLGEAPQPSINPYDFLDTTRFIGVTVGADPEMTPRMRLGAVPYAWTAGSASIAVTTYNSGVGTDQIADGTVGLIDLDPATVPAVGQTFLGGSTTSTSTATIAQFTVNAPGPGYLYVMVSGQWWLDADATSSSSLYAFFFMGLCDAPANSLTCEGTYDDYNYTDPDNVSSGNSTHGFSIARVVPIGSAGPVPFFLNGHVTAPGQTLYLYGGVTATAMFFPAGLSVTNPAAAVPQSQRSGE